MLRFFTNLLLLVVLAVTTFAKEVLKIQFLQTSDVHGKFMPHEYATASENANGSMVQVATAVKELRKEDPNTIVLDTGDSIQDNYHELFLKDDVSPVVAAQNYIGYDVWVPGNHEFNFGMDTLFHVQKSAKAKMLLANFFDKDGKRVFEPYLIVDVKGAKVAIIGVATPHIKKWDAENLKEYSTTNPIEEVKKLIPELEKKADVIVAAVHMGPDEEYGEGDSAKELAKEVPQLAAVFAAHSHSVIGDERVNGTPVVEPGKMAEYIGRVVVTLEKEGNKWVLANKEKDITASLVKVKDYKPDPELEKQLQPYHERALKEASTVIGELKGGDLVPADEIKGIPTAQIQPTAMIQLINEVQKHYTNADVSAAASFRDDANMKAGPIKKSDVALIYKYDNTLRAYRMTGAQLKKYMEWSAKYYNQYKPGDLTVSFNPNIRGYNYDMFNGVKYDVNISKPEGQRIENLTKEDGTPIKDDDKVVVAVNDYRAKSTFLSEKDGLFKPDEIELVVDLAQTMGDEGRIRDLIGKYITEVKGGTITPEVEQNWKITGAEWDPKKREEIIKLVNEGKIQVPKSSDGRTPNVKSLTEKDLEKAEK